MTYAEWKEWRDRIFGSEEAHLESIPKREWYRSFTEEGQWFSRDRVTDLPPEFDIEFEGRADGEG